MNSVKIVVPVQVDAQLDEATNIAVYNGQYYRYEGGVASQITEQAVIKAYLPDNPITAAIKAKL